MLYLKRWKDVYTLSHIFFKRACKITIVESGVLDSHNVIHATDILPTILEYTACERPSHRNGVELSALYGKSLVSLLSGTETAVRGDDEALCFEMVECKAVIKGYWKAVQLYPPYGDGVNWQPYNLENDIIEKKDLSESEPLKLKELVTDWQNYAASVGYIEGNGQPILDIQSDMKLFYTFDPTLVDTAVKE